MRIIINNILPVNLIFFILFLPMQNIVNWGNTELQAQTQQACDENLDKAEDAYYDSDYNTCLELIRICLKESDISDEQRLRAYTILTRTFIALEQIEKAKEYIYKILEINPEYLPTIEEETPTYVNTVLIVKTEKQKKAIAEEESSGLGTWLWVGVGGVVTTAAIIVIASTGEEKKETKEQALPLPPQFP